MWIFGFKLQLAMCGLSMLVIFYYPTDLTLPYIILIFIFTSCNSICNCISFTSSGVFFARISDSRIGGTYLTLLNTLNNFGGTWPNFFVFYLVDLLTSQTCSLDSEVKSYYCNTKTVNECVQNGGNCNVILDGFYIVGSLSICFGLFMVSYCKRHYIPLQYQSVSMWKPLENDSKCV